MDDHNECQVHLDDIPVNSICFLFLQFRYVNIFIARKAIEETGEFERGRAFNKQLINSYWLLCKCCRDQYRFAIGTKFRFAEVIPFDVIHIQKNYLSIYGVVRRPITMELFQCTASPKQEIKECNINKEIRACGEWKMVCNFTWSTKLKSTKSNTLLRCNVFKSTIQCIRQ